MNIDQHIRFEKIVVNLIELKVWVGSEHIHFTLSELRLLLAFLAEPHRTLSRDQLIQRADLTSIAHLHVLITRLRTLLKQQYIFTLRGGVGYSFTAPAGVNKESYSQKDKAS